MRLETVQVIKKQYGYDNVKNDGWKIFNSFQGEGYWEWEISSVTNT